MINKVCFPEHWPCLSFSWLFTPPLLGDIIRESLGRSFMQGCVTGWRPRGLQHNRPALSAGLVSTSAPPPGAAGLPGPRGSRQGGLRGPRSFSLSIMDQHLVVSKAQGAGAQVSALCLLPTPRTCPSTARGHRGDAISESGLPGGDPGHRRSCHCERDTAGPRGLEPLSAVLVAEHPCVCEHCAVPWR